ncbi:MAG: hemerythrin domain-containing protein [Azonexus sp.]
MSLQQFLQHDHRDCDDLFAVAEQAAGDGDLTAAADSFGRFHQAVLRHFAAEESTLFPAFEDSTGMRMGPTQVMRMEHEQMRGMMDAAGDALAAGDREGFLGQADSLLITMQQHNMKEENVLYPMCDQHLAADAPALLERLQAALREG